jgi:hypothetical protein
MTYVNIHPLKKVLVTIKHGDKVRVDGFYRDMDKEFRAGSVVGYAMQNGEDPYAAVVRNEENRVKFTYTEYKSHWFNAEATCLMSEAYVELRAKQAAERDAAPRCKLGDWVIFDGIVFQLDRDHNQNVRLSRVPDKQVTQRIMDIVAAAKATG